MRGGIAAGVLLWVAACGPQSVDMGNESDTDAPAPPDLSKVDTVGGDSATDPGPPGAERGVVDLTFYWLAVEDDFDGTANTALYDSQCDVIAVVPSQFASSLKLEGSGRLADGRVLNYWGSCGCANSPCFSDLGSSSTWGLGVQSRPLVPFRSIAVDRDLFDIGDSLYVAELDGVTMPGSGPWGGFVHDGCVVADDIGGAINGAHIDFFSGLRSHYVDIQQSAPLSQVTVHDGGERCD